MAITFAVEKLFKIGLFVSTLAVLGAPTVAMITSAFQTSEAITFQDSIVNEVQLVYAGKLVSVNNNLMLPKNTSVTLFTKNSLGQETATDIIINITTPLGNSGDIIKTFPNNLTIYQDGGDVPSTSQDESQCFDMTTKRDKTWATIKVTFTKTTCGQNG
ncbi:MAG: hypothetical protein WCE94_08960 [Candidatus Methanoperedens sp.]